MSNNMNGFTIQMGQWEPAACDVCGSRADYDAKTTNGRWAYLCTEHFKMQGMGIGLGRGQRLVYGDAVSLSCAINNHNPHSRSNAWNLIPEDIARVACCELVDGEPVFACAQHTIDILQMAIAVVGRMVR